MFAVQFDRFGPPEVLFVGPFPEPHAGRGEVRVTVRAAGVGADVAGVTVGDEVGAVDVSRLGGPALNSPS